MLECHGVIKKYIEGIIEDNTSDFMPGLGGPTNITRFPYMVYTVDLCVKRLLDCREIQTIIKQARVLMGHPNKSTTAMASLKTMCEALNVNLLTPRHDAIVSASANGITGYSGSKYIAARQDVVTRSLGRNERLLA